VAGGDNACRPRRQGEHYPGFQEFSALPLDEPADGWLVASISFQSIRIEIQIESFLRQLK
jgi:hypothetical protein